MQMSAEGGEDASCVLCVCVMGTISATLCASARCYGAVLVYQKGAPPINFISVVSLCSGEK